MPVDDDDWVVEKTGSPASPASPSSASPASAPGPSEDASESAAADWAESSVERKRAELKARAPRPERKSWPAGATIVCVLAVVVAVAFAARFALRSSREPAREGAQVLETPPPSAAATSTNPPALAPFATRAAKCGVALPAGFGEIKNPARCVPLGFVSAALDKKLRSWRMCPIPDGAHPPVAVLIDHEGALRGAELSFGSGGSEKSVADVFASDVGFGALYGVDFKPPKSSDSAVVAEADCGGVAIVAHALCPSAMLHFADEHGARVANPAPWPGCRLGDVFAFDGAP